MRSTKWRANGGSAASIGRAQVGRLEPVVGDLAVLAMLAPVHVDERLDHRHRAPLLQLLRRRASTDSMVLWKRSWLRSISSTWAWRVTARKGTKPSARTHGSGSWRRSRVGGGMPALRDPDRPADRRRSARRRAGARPGSSSLSTILASGLTSQKRRWRTAIRGRDLCRRPRQRYAERSCAAISASWRCSRWGSSSCCWSPGSSRGSFATSCTTSPAPTGWRGAMSIIRRCRSASSPRCGRRSATRCSPCACRRRSPARRPSFSPA